MGGCVFFFYATAVLPQHVNTPAKLERVVTLLTGFRLYMHYHIKATKSYLHSRMRERVDKLLQGTLGGTCCFASTVSHAAHASRAGCLALCLFAVPCLLSWFPVLSGRPWCAMCVCPRAPSLGVVVWVAVLNRAVPEDPFTVKHKKLITGRTFVRKD